MALVGANGAGKTTLLRIITGELAPHAGAVTRSGGLGRDAADGRHRARRRADRRRPAALGGPPRVRSAAAEVDRVRAGADGDRRREDPAALRRRRWPSTPTPAATTSRSPGTSARSRRSACPTTARSTASCAPCPAASRSGWCWSTCWPGPTRCCCSTSRTTSSTCPARSGWRGGSGSPTRRSSSSATTASCSPTPPPGWSPSSSARPATWCGPTRAASRRTTRPAGTASCASRSCARRWDEEHAKLKRAGAACTSRRRRTTTAWPRRYQAAQTRLRKFEEAGPPTEQPREQQVKMRLKGGRTGKRAVVCEHLELTGLMKPFDLEVWYGERVAVLGSQRLRQVPLPAAAGRRRQRPRRRAPARRRHRRSSRSATPAGPSSAPGSGRAGSCRPTSTPS